MNADMDWHEVGRDYYRRVPDDDHQLASLAADWQRELVALMLLNREVWNGGYLQFISNHGREMYIHAVRALTAIGAPRSVAIIDRCQALVDEHFPTEGRSHEERRGLLPNEIIDRQGRTVKEAGSVLPEAVRKRVSELAHEFMGYPDGDMADLAQRHYGPLIEANARLG